MDKIFSAEWIESFSKSVRDVADFNLNLQRRLNDFMSKSNVQELSTIDYDEDIFTNLKLDCSTKEEYSFNLDLASVSLDNLINLLNNNYCETRGKFLKELNIMADEILAAKNIKHFVDTCKEKMQSGLSLRAVPESYLQSLEKLKSNKNKDVIVEKLDLITNVTKKSAETCNNKVLKENNKKHSVKNSRISILDFTIVEEDAACFNLEGEDNILETTREYEDTVSSDNENEKKSFNFDDSCGSIEKLYFKAEDSVVGDLSCSLNLSYLHRSIQEKSKVEDDDEEENDLLNQAVIEDDELTGGDVYNEVSSLGYSFD